MNIRFDWKAIRYWQTPLLRRQTVDKPSPVPPKPTREPVGFFRPAAAASLALLAGCATMVKPGMTADSKAADRYECEQETYAAAQGNAYMVSNEFYRDCMRARGYR